MIAHRISTIKHADQIVVMSKGQIVKTDTHETLIGGGCELYKAMWEAHIGAKNWAVNSENGREETLCLDQ